MLFACGSLFSGTGLHSVLRHDAIVGEVDANRMAAEEEGTAAVFSCRSLFSVVARCYIIPRFLSVMRY